MPVRTRSFEVIKELIKNSIENSGSSEVSLLSLSVIDHPEIESILKWFVENYYDKHYSISLPSFEIERTVPVRLKLFRLTGKKMHPDVGL